MGKKIAVSIAQKFALPSEDVEAAMTDNAPPNDHNSYGFAGAALRQFIERIERLEEEKAALAVDIRDVFAEAKANGFDTKTMRAVLKLRRMEQSDRTEQEYMLDLYKRALGMAVDNND